MLFRSEALEHLPLDLVDSEHHLDLVDLEHHLDQEVLEHLLLWIHTDMLHNQQPLQHILHEALEPQQIHQQL